MAMAKAARAPPNVSSGSVYILTLKAATENMASEIPAADQAGLGIHGMAAAARERTAARKQTRVRAATASAPRRIRSSESQPPVKPPNAAKAKGIHENPAAAASERRCTSLKYDTVKLVQKE